MHQNHSQKQRHPATSDSNNANREATIPKVYKHNTHIENKSKTLNTISPVLVLSEYRKKKFFLKENHQKLTARKIRLQIFRFACSSHFRSSRIDIRFYFLSKTNDTAPFFLGWIFAMYPNGFSHPICIVICFNWFHFLKKEWSLELKWMLSLLWLMHYLPFQYYLIIKMPYWNWRFRFRKQWNSVRINLYCWVEIVYDLYIVYTSDPICLFRTSSKVIKTFQRLL